MARGDGGVYLRGTRWWIRYYAAGKEQREPGGNTEQEARKRLRKRLAEKHVGDFVGPAQERLTVKAILDAYLVNRELAGKDMPEIRSAIKRVQTIGHWKAVQCTLPALERLAKEWIDAGLAPATAKNRLAFLAAAFKVTRRQGMHKLTVDLPDLPASQPRRGYFEPEQFEAVRANLPEPVNDIAAFADYSGWRKREVLDLPWSEIDHANQMAYLTPERSKTRRGRPLPLTGELGKVIERRWAARASGNYISPAVFHRDGRPVKTIDGAWKVACAVAGVPGRLFHDLRRTFVRDANNAAVLRESGKAITGHRSSRVFEEYDVRSTSDLVTALSQVQSHRAGLLVERSELAKRREARGQNMDAPVPVNA